MSALDSAFAGRDMQAIRQKLNEMILNERTALRQMQDLINKVDELINALRR